MQKLMID